MVIVLCLLNEINGTFCEYNENFVYLKTAPQTKLNLWSKGLRHDCLQSATKMLRCCTEIVGSDGDGKRKLENKSFITQNNDFARASRFFLHFFFAIQYNKNFVNSPWGLFRDKY